MDQHKETTSLVQVLAKSFFSHDLESSHQTIEFLGLSRIQHQLFLELMEENARLKEEILQLNDEQQSWEEPKFVEHAALEEIIGHRFGSERLNPPRIGDHSSFPTEFETSPRNSIANLDDTGKLRNEEGDSGPKEEENMCQFPENHDCNRSEECDKFDATAPSCMIPTTTDSTIPLPVPHNQPLFQANSTTIPRTTRDFSKFCDDFVSRKSNPCGGTLPTIAKLKAAGEVSRGTSIPRGLEWNNGLPSIVPLHEEISGLSLEESCFSRTPLKRSANLVCSSTCREKQFEQKEDYDKILAQLGDESTFSTSSKSMDDTAKPLLQQLSILITLMKQLQGFVDTLSYQNHNQNQLIQALQNRVSQLEEAIVEQEPGEGRHGAQYCHGKRSEGAAPLPVSSTLMSHYSPVPLQSRLLSSPSNKNSNEVMNSSNSHDSSSSKSPRRAVSMEHQLVFRKHDTDNQANESCSNDDHIRVKMPYSKPSKKMLPREMDLDLLLSTR